MVAWPSGLRRWFKAPVFTGASSNLAAIKFFFSFKKIAILIFQYEREKRKDKDTLFVVANTVKLILTFGFSSSFCFVAVNSLGFGCKLLFFLFLFFSH